VRDEYRTYYDGGRGGYGKLLKTELDALAAEANGEGEGEEEGAGRGLHSSTRQLNLSCF
jgi:endonuclease-3/nuclear cap-binding protein subunit 2